MSSRFSSKPYIALPRAGHFLFLLLALLAAILFPHSALATSRYGTVFEGSYLVEVETDARFTNYKNFVSSDYMLKDLGIDPAKTQKRLGDGFYEQKLVTDQITELTGRRYLGQYADNEAQYKALMESGIAAAKKFDLTPGVALTPAQVAALTSDIVWMVEQEVVLADGKRERVLVPQVYLTRLHGEDLKPSGALIAADDISLLARDTLENTGLIKGGTRTLVAANDILNRGGTITSAGETTLRAGNDILNQSGTIGGQRVALVAGRDIVNTTLTRDYRTGSANFGSSNTLVGNQGLIAATEDLELTAKRDITLTGALVQAGGNASLHAGRNLTLDTVAAETTGRADLGYSLFDVKQTTYLGSGIETGGNLTLTSGKDMRITAATLNAGTSASLLAEGDLTLDAVKDSLRVERNGIGAGSFALSRRYDETVKGASLNAGGGILLAANGIGAKRGDIALNAATLNSDNGSVGLIAVGDIAIGTVAETHSAMDHVHTESSGFLSSSSTTTRNESNRLDALGSTVSGDSIDLIAGRDLTVTGSGIAGSRDVSLYAKGDIDIKAATSTYSESHYSHTEESGLLSGGGLGFTIGTRNQTDRSNANGTLQNQNRSMVGSIGGNLSLNAGEHAHISGSDILAGNDLGVFAKNITLDTGLDRNEVSESHQFEQSGLSVGLSGGVIGYAQSAFKEAKTAVSGKGSVRRIANLAMLLDDATSLKSSASDIVDGFKKDGITGAAKASGISLNVSVGSSSSSSQSQSVSETVVGSRAIAGGNLTLTATEGDLKAVGSQIAGKDVALNAAKDILLESAQNKNTATSQSSSSSASVGVSVGISSQGVGVSANLSVAQASGNSDLNQTIQANTQVSAENKLTLNSGGDTTLAGAQARGERIAATVGGNFTVESRQDTGSFVARDQNSSIGVSVPITGGSFSEDFNSSSQSIDSNYRSVVEQSGLYAGKEGFDINVQKHTQLDGGILASEADAGKNSLTTGTFGTRDLQNSSSYQADSNSIGVDENIFSKYGAAKTALSSAYNDIDQSGQQNGITRAAVADGTITIASNDAASLAAADNVSRDTENANQTVQAFDGQQIYTNLKKDAEQRQEDTQLVTRVTDDAYNTMFNTDPKIYKVTCPPGENCTQDPGKATVTEVTDKTEIKNAEGNVVVAVNGISNPLERAGDLVFQNTSPVSLDPNSSDYNKKPETIYIMHYTPASTTVGELLIAGYEKTLTSVSSGTANFLGYTNQDVTYANILERRGSNATTSLGHSRGTIVQTNAFNILNGQGYSNDQLTVRGVGGAVTAQTYTDAAKSVNGNHGENVNFNYFVNDPVSVWAGGNPGTASLGDLWSVMTTSNSVHSCYGTGASGCGQVEISSPGGPGNSGLMQFNNGQPVASTAQ